MSWSDIQDELVRRWGEAYGIKESTDMTQIVHKEGTICLSVGCHGECLGADGLYKLYRSQPDKTREMNSFEDWLYSINISPEYIRICSKYLTRDQVNEVVIGKDNVNHPPHYQNKAIKCEHCSHIIECIDVVRHMNFNIGNAIKYIWRSKYKGKQIEDLQKAIWYLQDEIKKQEEFARIEK